MEGGVLPWKRQAGEQESYGDYSKLSQPLPNPPEGYYWTKDDQGEYRLLEEATWRLLRHLPPPLDGNGSDESKIVAVTSAASCSNVVVATPIDEFVPDAPSVSPDYIFHTILPDDTLIGTFDFRGNHNHNLQVLFLWRGSKKTSCQLSLVTSQKQLNLIWQESAFDIKWQQQF